MKTLVIGPAWIGDMVMAQSLYKKLIAENPQAGIDVVAPDWSHPLVNRMPEVRRPIPLPVGHGRMGWRIRRQIGKRLIDEGYAWAIVTPRSWKSALIPFFAKIPKRTGFLGEFRYGLLTDVRRLDKTLLDQTVLRYLYLGEPAETRKKPAYVPYPALSVDAENQATLAASLNLDLSRPAVCFFPGAAYGPSKQWPADYFQKLGEMLISDGYQIWIMGSANEKALGDQITDTMGNYGINLCGRTALIDTIDLMPLAACAVTNDSGLMHVAAAVNLPLQAIYGSSTPAYTPPLSTKARVHYLGIECSPCFKRRCPYGHYNCLYGIFPEQVHQSILTDQKTGQQSSS